ncbi:P-loop NTPase fold protein [Albimonas sp. CAU 1670]|uniref:P-loop NTPase fold protein n=1 Tax=Albimonas sp. CAU 1670 TaxID=3032599 RepID=UPI0023D9873D|nr:P-loop NTPase fold protein [Albimonas sp. CAU 1670]MDF2235006.1 P-loop NTPase fold protein [Albimonas sp. CAU 1670]
MASAPPMEPEEILRAAVEDPGEGTLGDLAQAAERVQGVLEKLDPEELRRSYDTLVRIVGPGPKEEDADAAERPLYALASLLDRMSRPFRDRPGVKSSEAEDPAASKAAFTETSDPSSEDASDKFDPSEDPRVALLASAAGRAVPLGALIEAHVGDPPLPLFGMALANTLSRAGEMAAAATVPDPQGGEAPLRLLTPAALLAALIAFAQDIELHGEDHDAAYLAGYLSDVLPEPPEPAFASTDADGPPLLAPELLDVLAAAAALQASAGRGAEPIALAATLAALVATPAGRQAWIDLGLLGDEPARAFESLRAMVEEMGGRDLPSADRRRWSAALDEAWGEGDPLQGLNLRRPVRLVFPDYAADDVARRRGADRSMLDADRLGVAADARALADLICLKAARPPLAIGLFGPWGSGKSTFMRMIEEAAEADRAAAAAMRAEGVSPPFVESVAHVWFNAWHYLDANLWASLVSHIFRELHRLSRGASPEEARRMDYLVEKLASAAQAETAAREGVRAADASVKKARRRVAAADRLRACLRRKLAQAAPRALDDLLEAKTREGLDALQAAGLAAPLHSVEQLQDLRRELSGLGGRLRLAGGALLKGGWRSVGWLVLAAGALLVLGGAGAWLNAEAGGRLLPAWLAGFLADGMAWLGAAGALAAVVVPHLRRANAALDALAAAEEEARAALARAEAGRRRLEADLARLEAERLRAQDDLDARRRERERLEAMRRGEEPAEMLAQFIEERARAEGYRKHLGLLSQIRSDFELMADLLAPRNPKQREDAAARIGAAPERLPQIERIVLYIDDLDRCRDEQVVEVLEAIHLLLAFDLFVVVVGVDARWVEGALSRFYEKQLAAGSAPDGRPSVADYLEKIFQIPFRLRPMALGEGGGYSRLVAELVGPVQERPGDPAAPGRDTEPGRPDDAADGRADPGDATSEGAAPALPLVDLSAVWPREETPEQVLERVTLTRAELDAIEALGPLVGRSPRTAKRFVNLYRLLRSRRRGEDLEAFLSPSDGSAPPFLATLFWLSLETGLDARQTALLGDVLQGDYTWSWSGLASDLSGPDHRPGDGAGLPDGERPEFDRRRAFWDSIEDPEQRRILADGFSAMDGVDPDARAVIVVEASRYSFHFGRAV